MHHVMEWPESRAVRLLLLAPVVIVAWLVLTFFASSTSASATVDQPVS